MTERRRKTKVRSAESPKVTPPTDEEREAIRRGFLALALAHELKQPLNSLNLNLELLGKRLPPGVDLSGPSGALGRAVDRVGDILDSFTKRVLPDPVDEEPRNLAPILECALGTLGARAARVRLDVAPGLPQIAVHPRQLVVALAELIDNALLARPDGDVVVRVQAEEDEVRIEVKDTGTGMTPDIAKHAHEIGFSTWGRDGTGLTVAKFAAYHHGGGFHLETAPGKGTTACMYLPIPEED